MLLNSNYVYEVISEDFLGTPNEMNRYYLTEEQLINFKRITLEFSNLPRIGINKFINTKDKSNSLATVIDVTNKCIYLESGSFIYKGRSLECISYNELYDFSYGYFKSNLTCFLNNELFIFHRFADSVTKKSYLKLITDEGIELKINTNIYGDPSKLLKICELLSNKDYVGIKKIILEGVIKSSVNRI